MTSELLAVDKVDDAVSMITLNRPDRRNALTIELMQALCETITRLEAESGERILIIRGSGPAFCSGLDLQEASRPELAEESAGWVARLFETIFCSPLVTIAAAHGSAYAGGAGLLASCDFAIGSEDLKLAFPEVRRGLLPALVAVLLKDRIRSGDARELFLLAEPITAARAQAMGLLQRVVRADQLLEEARSLASSVLKGGPEAVRNTKRLLRKVRSPDFSLQLANALEFHKQSRATGEAAEGFASFLEHREPAWNQKSADGPTS